MKSVSVLLVLLNIMATTQVCWSQKASPKFELVGETVGFEDSTMLYLDGFDSTYIVENKFRFTGRVKDGPENVLIRTKNYTDYKFFWLENATITFAAEKGKFREAVVTGSKTQEDDDRLLSEIKATGDEKKASIAFIARHPNSLASAKVLSVYASTWGKDTASRLYDALSQEMKNSSHGKKIAEFIALNKNVKLGDKYVDFTQNNMRGKSVALSSLEGNVVLLEFWGSWCGPCRAGHPELVKIYEEFKGKEFRILGVASDSQMDALVEAIRKDGLPWENVSDLRGNQNKAALMYGVSYYPTNYLINKDGIIIAKDLRGEDLRKKLHEVLK